MPITSSNEFKSRQTRARSVLLLLVSSVVISSFGLQSSFAATYVPSDGTLDTSFNSGGVGFNGNTVTMVEQPDGKVIVGGMFTQYNGASAVRIARLNSDGTRDATFDSGLGFNGTVNALLLLPDDNSVIVGGAFDQYNGVATPGRIVKLSATGVLDTTFLTGMPDLNGSVVTLERLADGSIVAGGQFTGSIIKFDQNGNVDNIFMTAIGPGFSMDPNPNSRITTVFDIVQQAGGNLIVVGVFNNLGGTAIPAHVTSLNLDGSRTADAGTFNFNLTSGFGGDGGVGAFSIAKQSDGKLVIGGQFTTFNGSPFGRIVRLNTDGTVDTTFVTGTGFNLQVEHVSVDFEGKLLVSLQGNPGTYGGEAVTGVLRLNSNGTLDRSFSAPTASFKTFPISTGAIYVTGYFTSYTGTPVGRFMRLTATESSGGSGTPGSSDSGREKSREDFVVGAQATTPELARTGLEAGNSSLLAAMFVTLGLLALIIARRSTFSRSS